SVQNLGDGPVVVKVRLADWTMSETGDIHLLDPGTTPVSLQGFVEFEPRVFSLGPGESGVVHVVLRLPLGGPATRYGVLLSEVRPTSWPKNQLGPRAIAELGTTLYLSRIPPDLTRAELTGLDPRAVGDSTIAVAVRLRNPGQRHFYSSGEVALRDSAGAMV